MLPILHKAVDKSTKRMKNCMLVKFCFFTNSLLYTIKTAGIHKHGNQHCIHTVFFYTPLSPYTKAVTVEVLTGSVKWSVVAGVEQSLPAVSSWPDGKGIFPPVLSCISSLKMPLAMDWVSMQRSLTAPVLLYRKGSKQRLGCSSEPDQFLGETHAGKRSLLSESRREARNLDCL